MSTLRTLTLLTFGALSTTVACAESPAPAAAASAVPAHVNAPQAAKLLEKNPKTIIIDVRTEGEFKGGHLAGAKNINVLDAGFEAKLAGLDKKAKYLLHCQSGGRSTRALGVFNKLGFKNVSHMDGGMMGWKAAKLPVVK